MYTYKRVDYFPATNKYARQFILYNINGGGRHFRGSRIPDFCYEMIAEMKLTHHGILGRGRKAEYNNRRFYTFEIE